MDTLVINPAQVRGSKTPVRPTDVGASNTRCSLAIGGNVGEVATFHTRPSPEYLDRLTAADSNLKFELMVLGAAGPVANNAVDFTNLGLKLSGAELRNRFLAAGRQTDVTVVNDAKCGAAGIIMLPNGQIVQVHGSPTSLRHLEEVVVVMFGTGQGAARILGGTSIRDGELGHPWARASSNLRVTAWMNEKFGGAVEFEHYVSGLGLELIVQALIETKWDLTGGAEAAEMLRPIAKHERAKQIAEWGRKNAHPVFAEAMWIYREQLGFLISSHAMYADGVVLAGKTITNDFDYLFGAGSPIREHITNRRNLRPLAEAIPVFAALPEVELNLVGAAAIGAMMASQA